MLYRLIKPFLLSFRRDTARKFILWTLSHLGRIPFFRGAASWFYGKDSKILQRQVFDMQFKSPVGLASGFDRSGEACSELAAFGFSFITAGPVSTFADDGNKGVKNLIENIRHRSPDTILAAELVRSSHDSSENDIIRDYSISFSLLYDFADIFVVSAGGSDIDILSDILDELLSLRLCYESYKPILIRLAPEVDSVQLKDILHYARMSGIDGIVADANDYVKTLELVKNIRSSTGGSLPIIAGGDICDEGRAAELLDAGASLIQLGDELLDKGPGYVKRILKKLIENSL